MALTPTALIAVSGIMKGDGIGLNSTMTSMISKTTANPLVSGATALGTPATLAMVPGLSTTLASMPAAIVLAGPAATTALTQAQKMLPSAGSTLGNKSFIHMFGSASSFGSASAEYSAALSEFGGKSFGDLGVGVKNFTGVLSGGVSSLIPVASLGLIALVNQSKQANFGSLAKVLPLNPLGQGSQILKGSFAEVGSSMKNFGTAYDFKDLGNLGSPNALVSTLQKQGLADRYGINDQIAASGYDPKNIASVPAGVLTPILQSVRGDDLLKIQAALGVKPTSPMATLNDMTDVKKFMSPAAISAMGLNNSKDGLKSLGNTLTNLGVQTNNLKMGDMMGKIETNSFTHLETVKTLIPTSVSSAISPLLGKGGGPFGNPTMHDMMGSVSGAHTDSFKSASDATAGLMNSQVGQDVNSAMTALNVAVANNDSVAIAAAKASLDSATAALNVAAVANPDLNKSLTKASTGISDSTAHLAKEKSNLALAGVNIDMSSTTATDVGGGVSTFLSFGTKLHTMGVDKTKVGYSKVLENATTDSLAGDALRATLMEGRNIASTSTVGKAPAAVADQMSATRQSLKSQVVSLQQAESAAKKELDLAKVATLADPANQQTADTYTIAYEKWVAASSATTEAVNA